MENSTFTTKKSVFVICPLSSSEVMMKNTFGEHHLFLRAPAGILNLTDQKTIQRLVHLIYKEAIEQIILVKEISCPFGTEILFSKRHLSLFPFSYNTELYLDHFLRFDEKKSIRQKIDFLNELTWQRQALEFHTHPILSFLLEHYKIKVVGMLGDKQRELFKEVSIPQIPYGFTFTR